MSLEECLTSGLNYIFGMVPRTLAGANEFHPIGVKKKNADAILTRKTEKTFRSWCRVGAALIQAVENK